MTCRTADTGGARSAMATPRLGRGPRVGKFPRVPWKTPPHLPAAWATAFRLLIPVPACRMVSTFPKESHEDDQTCPMGRSDGDRVRAAHARGVGARVSPHQTKRARVWLVQSVFARRRNPAQYLDPESAV